MLDDPIVNAFALPGGYCYVTRGILACLNNEAALAGVMGHEVGHVTVQHGVTKMSTQGQAGIGLAAGLPFLKYGRDDERQTDGPGAQYATTCPRSYSRSWSSAPSEAAEVGGSIHQHHELPYPRPV